MCVLNSHHIPRNLLPANTVFIGEGSEWALPFKIGIDGTREEVMEMYKHHLAQHPETLQRIDKLQDKNLLGFSAPLPCHGDILHDLSKLTYRERIAWAAALLWSQEKEAA